MAKKKSSGAGGLLLLALLFGLGAAYKWCKENIEIVFVALIFVFIGLVVRVLLNRKAHRDWVRHLKNKYRDDEVVTGILNAQFWKGQTQEQLRDSLGRPHAVDSQQLKTKTKEVWKYGQQRKGQFSLRITLENGAVVGWDQKA